MTDCWKEEPRSRLSFFQLIEKLEVIMQRDAPYLDLNKYNEDHPYYNVPPESSGDKYEAGASPIIRQSETKQL